MKDALGHGSDGNMAAHQSGVRSATGGMRVEKLNTNTVRTAAGQSMRTGRVWERVASGKRTAVAERIAQMSRIDNPNSIIRVRR